MRSEVGVTVSEGEGRTSATYVVTDRGYRRAEPRSGAVDRRDRRKLPLLASTKQKMVIYCTFIRRTINSRSQTAVIAVMVGESV